MRTRNEGTGGGQAQVVIAGNWKMHFGPDEAQAYFRRFVPAPPARARTLIFPPAVSLVAARGAAAPEIEFGVQNIHWAEQGAFTGEVSAAMAAMAGARWALIGHSERRTLFGETDEETAKKTAAAVDAGLSPLLCVGERIEERREGRLRETLERQVAAALPELLRAREFMVAYEPVWAIGTGETAKPGDAKKAHAIIREALVEAREAPVLYGGSVGPDNVFQLVSEDGVDGVLVGGASLDPATFSRISKRTA